MITILIPLRNEYENLEEIERIFRENFNEISHEVILINDFSTDETFSKAKDMSERNKNYPIGTTTLLYAWHCDHHLAHIEISLKKS